MVSQTEILVPNSEKYISFIINIFSYNTNLKIWIFKYSKNPNKKNFSKYMNFGILKKVLFLLSADKINLSKEKFNSSGKEYQMNKIQNQNLKQIKNLMLKKIK